MHLIDAKQLTEKERRKLAAAAQKSRPSAEQRAEFRVLARHWRQYRHKQSSGIDITITNPLMRR